MPRHHRLLARGRKIDVHDSLGVADTGARVASLQRWFGRMPEQHLAVVHPIFLIERKPHRGRGGGTWAPREVRHLLGEGDGTGVPDEDLRFLMRVGNGLCGAANEVVRHSVEAYARFILSPASICRRPVPDVPPRHATLPVIAALRATPAFAMLPAEWMPGA